MKFGIAAPRQAGFISLMLDVASLCCPSGDRIGNKPKPAATNRPVSRPKTKRLARDSDPAHSNGVGAPTNPGPTTPSTSLQFSSSFDLESARTKAESGDVEAQTALGNYYATGQRGRIDLAEAVKWYRAAAEQGEVRAQYNLANMYAEGRGAPRDDREAAKWFYQAAEQGDRMAQYSIGLMCANGQGVAASNEEANKWFQLSAQQGDAMAQLKLAMA